MEKVDLFYECISEAALFLYEKLNYNYLDIIYRISCDLNSEVDETALEEVDVEKLKNIYSKILKVSFSVFDIQKAFLLFLVDIFKELDLSFDVVTPSKIANIFSLIINNYYDKKIKVLDLQLGVGNLVYLIALNYLNEIEIIGVDNNPILVKIAQTYANFINLEISIYYQDTLSYFEENVDLIVGDLDNIAVDKMLISEELLDIEYGMYHNILNYYNNLKEDGLYIVVIPNDFFLQKDFKIFKEKIKDKLLLSVLIMLPLSLFKNEENSKSILVCKKTKTQEDMQIVFMDSLDNEKNIDQILKIIKTIKKKEN